MDKGFKDECFRFRFYLYEAVAQRTKELNATCMSLIIDLSELTYYKCASVESKCDAFVTLIYLLLKKLVKLHTSSLSRSTNF